MTVIDNERELDPQTALTARAGRPTAAPGPLTDAVLRIGVSVVLGWLAIVVGSMMILVGYLRVDAGSSLAEQLAYFASSCVGGLALIGLGGLAVLSRQYADAQRAVEEIARRARGESTQARSSTAQTDGRGKVAIGEGSSTYHTVDCVFLDGRADVRLTSSRGSEVRSMRACQICRPDQP